MSTGTEQKRNISQRRRTRRQGVKKNCRITISLDSGEHRELESAARESHLTLAAFVADRALAAARQQEPMVPIPLREAMLDLNHATAQLQRAGTNFNQAVAAFNSTGQAPGNLVQSGWYTASVAAKVKEAVDRVQARLP